MKKTRKTRRHKKQTRKMRGGARARERIPCPTTTPEQQDIVNFWKTTSDMLNTLYDKNYRTEWHVIQKQRSCNMWVWKKGETSKLLDRHLDCYWNPYKPTEKILWVLASTNEQVWNSTTRRHESRKAYILSEAVDLSDMYESSLTYEYDANTNNYTKRKFDQEIFCKYIADFIDYVYNKAF